MKVHFGRKFNKAGEKFTRFIPLTLEETEIQLTKLRAESGKLRHSMNGREVSRHRWLDKKIVREGNYLFLNLTQAEFFLGDKNQNTAIKITDLTKAEMKK